MKTKVLLAMSGGVDSTYSALMLKKKNYQVIGIHFILNEKTGDVDLVKKVAQNLGIDLHIENISKKFQKEVVDYLVDEYNKNQTPNPCVKCNRKIKFDMLEYFADKYGCHRIATGHYARVQKNKLGKYSLLRARDKNKDQSYYLYRLGQKDLEKIIFPLGDKEKEEIKKAVFSEGIDVPAKESQDICFFSAGEKVGQFLQKHLTEKQEGGNIVDEDGRVLGKHPGLIFYTLGQRKGLDLSGGPFFVIGKDIEENKLLVSKTKKHPLLMKDVINFGDVSWVNLPPEEKTRYLVKSRYRGSEIYATIENKGSHWEARPEKSVWAPASGQSLVVYEGEELIGGGTIL